MKVSKTFARRSWSLQAYLAVSPSSPHWSNVELSAIAGWQDYHRWEHGKLIRDPRLTDSSGWDFVSAEAGLEVLQELLKLEQPYYLRVVETQVVSTEVVLGGYDIPKGTVVRKPDGSYPTFMKKPVPGCVDEMPELFSNAS